jgi:hypothetical protein
MERKDPPMRILLINVPTCGRCIARNECHGLERENRVGSREIRRVSRREISQAGRGALALARLAILETRPTQQLHPGPCNFPGSCNPSVRRSNFAPA